MAGSPLNGQPVLRGHARQRRTVGRALEELWSVELPRDAELDRLRMDAVVALERLSWALTSAAEG